MSMLHFSTQRIHAEGFTPKAIDPISSEDQAAFLKACKTGDLEIVKTYCEKHPKSVNVQDAHGKSGLMLAARSGAFRVVEYLAAVPGYAVDMEDGNWENALFDAAAANSTKIVSLLLKKNIPVVVNKSGKYAAEILTTNTPSKEMFKLLSEAIQMQEDREFTVLTRAYKLAEKTPDDAKKYYDDAEQLVGKKLECARVDQVLKKEEVYVNSEGKKGDRIEDKARQKRVIEDKGTVLKVVEFFRQNPPSSIEAARDTVNNRFGIKTTIDSLDKLLKWGGIEMKNESEEVD